ncbi:MAG: hypothetical protein LBT29_00795 [Flavobacteriaceae bacterium]|jgi:hypothetical protein|nr:hypothetical protein [Flavobacteriaceae bacterium]
MQKYRLIENLKKISYGALISGIVLLFYSLTIPKYSDDNKYQELTDRFYQEPLSKDAYYQEIAKITTNKTFIMDFGNGIVSFSLICFVFLFISKINKWGDFKNIKTQNKLGIFIMSNIAWLLMIPGTFLYYYYRGVRGDYPPFADSIGIPILQQITFVLLMLVPLNLFLLVSLKKSKLPTCLFVRLSIYKKTHILWEILFDIFLLLNTISLILFIADGDYIYSCKYVLYLITNVIVCRNIAR